MLNYRTHLKWEPGLGGGRVGADYNTHQHIVKARTEGISCQARLWYLLACVKSRLGASLVGELGELTC